MKINIFGVGRSGTKLVQLYISLIMLNEERTCYINYEPFYWWDRKCNFISSKGIMNHEQLPLFISKNEIKNFDSDYLKSKTLVNSKTIISKFIRGNGRIDFINRITRADKTIIIIRPITTVLNSIQGKSWDLLGKGLLYKNDWKRIVESVEKSNDNDAKRWLKNVKNDLDKNALYWYMMNQSAIDYAKDKNVLLLNFNDIALNPNDELGKIAKYLEKNIIDIDFRYVSGSSIHNDDFIVTINEIKPIFYRKFSIYYQYIVNEIIPINQRDVFINIWLNSIQKFSSNSKKNFIDHVKNNNNNDDDKLTKKKRHKIKKLNYKIDSNKLYIEMGTKIKKQIDEINN